MGFVRGDLLGQMRRLPVLRPLPASFGTAYQLIEPYEVKVQYGTVYIPAGYCYDGASIPTLMGLSRVAMTNGGKFAPEVMRASLVHDWFCDFRPPWISSNDAAVIFRDMLLEDGVRPWRAASMYRAVKWFGPKWDLKNATI